MSDFTQNAKAIKDIFKKDSIFPGKLGPANVDKDYPYGLAAPHPSLEAPVSKSWLFEIVDRKTGEIVQSFTLVLPPQGYTIKEPQRVSITKTFGNAFVDDYGPDNLQITLKGISGTTHAFQTFQTSKVAGRNRANEILGTESGLTNATDIATQATLGYTGRDAFYVFRNTIMRYKDTEGWEKNEMRVYDLADEQAYKCVLLDFTLDRSSESPLHYPFVISLFVYERLDNYRPKQKAINISADPIKSLNSVDSLIDKMGKLYKNIQGIVDATAMIKARSLELRSRWNKALQATTALLTSPLDLARNLVDSAFALVGIVKDTYDAGKYTFDRYMGAAEFARDILNNGLRVYGYQISEGWQRVQKLSIDEDRGIDTEGGSSVSASPTASEAVSRSSVITSYSFSGLNTYTVRGEDTFQRIALNELGDESLWPFVASVNPSISGNAELVPGEQIFIPVQVDPSNDTSKEQFIFSEDTARDPYGADIQLDSDGNMVMVNDDASLLSGVENVKQAINLRLNTEVGSLIKQSAYGIVAQAGFAGSTMAIRYMKMALTSTILQDPRVEAVENLVLQLGSDMVYASMDIKIVGSEKSIPVPVQI